MSELDAQWESSRQLWRENPKDKEDIRMLLQVLREKRQSFQELVGEQSKGEYMFGLPFAVVTALFAWRAVSPLIQLGYGCLTVTLLAASVITWWSAWRASAPPEPTLSLRDYHLALVALYDRRIRFLRGVKYWYAIPLLAGAGAVLLPLAVNNLPPPWGVLILFLALLGAWVGIWHLNDVRGVAEIETKKKQVNEFLTRFEQDGVAL